MTSMLFSLGYEGTGNTGTGSSANASRQLAIIFSQTGRQPPYLRYLYR